jgi:hypothetical protein
MTGKLACLAAVLAALVLVGTAAATQSGSGYRWPRRTLAEPATAVVHPDTNLSAAWRGFVQGAVDAWNAGQSNLHVVMGAPAACWDALRNAPTSNDICVREVTRGDVWWWGWTTVGGYRYGDTTMLALASVQLNDAKVNPANPAHAWRARYITCHELGEAIGLHDHSDSDDTATSYDPTCLTNDSSKVQDSPSSEDFAALQEAYSTVFPPPPPPKPCKKGKKRC